MSRAARASCRFRSCPRFTFTGDPGFGSSLAALFGTAPASP